MPIVQINMMEGRSAETKRAMVAAVTDALSDTLGAPPDAVRILINELRPENYALAGLTAADQPLSERPGRNNGSSNGNGHSTVHSGNGS